MLLILLKKVVLYPPLTRNVCPPLGGVILLRQYVWEASCTGLKIDAKRLSRHFASFRVNASLLKDSHKMLKQLDPLPIIVSTYTLSPIDTRPRHIQDFTLVAGYYNCSNEEVIEMKALANAGAPADRVLARVSYAVMADEIRFWQRREDE